MKLAPPRHSLSVNFATAALLLLVAALLTAAPILPLFAESTPAITGVDPASGKVDATITLTGTDLGKASVVAVLLSDDKNDYKATIVSQTDDKIVIKIPRVKPGRYNVSLQDAKTIMILPIKVTVEE